MGSKTHRTAMHIVRLTNKQYPSNKWKNSQAHNEYMNEYIPVHVTVFFKHAQITLIDDVSRML